MTASGTYESTVGLEKFSINYPEQCIPLDMSCEEYGDLLEEGCVPEGEVWKCTIDTELTSEETGTWSTSGTTITITADGEEPDESEYCVSGNALSIFTATESPGEDSLGTAVYRRKL